MKYSQFIQADLGHAFHLGASPHYPSGRWTNQDTRRLDRRTGLELLLVTIDWSSFSDSDITQQFKKWILSEDGRPKGVGLRSRKGKRTDTWRKKLEQLATLRMRRYYSLNEMVGILPDAWRNYDKFTDSSEIGHARKAARQTLLQLFPFLANETTPVSWQAI